MIPAASAIANIKVAIVHAFPNDSSMICGGSTVSGIVGIKCGDLVASDPELLKDGGRELDEIPLMWDGSKYVEMNIDDAGYYYATLLEGLCPNHWATAYSEEQLLELEESYWEKVVVAFPNGISLTIGEVTLVSIKVGNFDALIECPVGTKTLTPVACSVRASMDGHTYVSSVSSLQLIKIHDIYVKMH